MASLVLFLGYSAAVQAEGLRLSVNAPLRVMDEDCEGRPCGPNAWYEIEDEQGYVCTLSVFDWSEISIQNESGRTKLETNFEFKNFSNYADSRRVKSVCLQHSSEDPKLCVLESHKYLFVTSFSYRTDRLIICSRTSEHLLSIVDEKDARNVLRTLKSPWLTYY